MSVTLSPMATRYAVSDADDPFKKYWLAILIGIVFTSIWLLTPMLGERAIGSTSISAIKPTVDENVEQGLGAEAGGGLSLAMDVAANGTKDAGPLGSSLYQAPAESSALRAEDFSAKAAKGAKAAKATKTAESAAAPSTLADALKAVSESGGWNEKARKGFDAAPSAGAGAASGGRAGTASIASGTKGFGASNASVDYSAPVGLSGEGSSSAPRAARSAGAGGAAESLKAASAKSLLAASSTSGDGARSSLSQAFDGAKGGSKIAALPSEPGVYAALDTAPVNLKLSDPKTGGKKIDVPAGHDVEEAGSEKGSDMAKQMALQIVGLAIGGAIGGPLGTIVSGVVVKELERQQAQDQRIRDLEDKRQLDQSRQRLGLGT